MSNKKENATQQNTCVILPVYNTEKQLPQLIRELKGTFTPTQIICVNDGSQDKSQDICLNESVNLHSFPRNRGKAAALWQGFQMAISAGYAYAITLDSDGQHDPIFIQEFLKRQKENNAGMVIGRRDFNHKIMPMSRIMSNSITSGIVSYLVKTRIYDSQCGYRLYDLDYIKKVKCSSDGFQFETEIIFKYATQKARFAHVNISTIYAEEKSNIAHVKDTLKFIKLVLKEMRTGGKS